MFVQPRHDSLQFRGVSQQNWVKLDYSRILWNRLENSLEEITFGQGTTAREVRQTLRALMKTPYYSLAERLKGFGISTIAPCGSLMEDPASWQTLARLNIPANMEFNVGTMLGWGLGLSGIFAILRLFTCGSVHPDPNMPYQNYYVGPDLSDFIVTGEGLLGIFGGVAVLHTLIKVVPWIVKTIPNLIRFPRDYTLVFKAHNGFTLTDRQVERYEHVKEARYNLYRRLIRAPRKVFESFLERGRDLPLSSVLRTAKYGTIQEAKALLSHDSEFVRGLAFARVKDQLTLSEVSALTTLEEYDVFEQLITMKLPYTFFLPYLTGVRQIKHPPYSEDPILNLYRQFKDELSDEEVNSILVGFAPLSDEAFLEVAQNQLAKAEFVVAKAVAEATRLSAKSIQSILPLIAAASTEPQLMACLDKYLHLFGDLDPQLVRGLLEARAATKAIGVRVANNRWSSLISVKAALKAFESLYTPEDINAFFVAGHRTLYREGSNAIDFMLEVINHPVFSHALKVKWAMAPIPESVKTAVLAKINDADLTAAELSAMVAASYHDAALIKEISRWERRFTRADNLLICSAADAMIARFGFMELTPTLTGAEIESVRQNEATLPEMLEILAVHPQTLPETLARILANTKVISLTNIVDEAEYDVTSEQTSYEGVTTSYTYTVPAVCHTEFTSSPVTAALALLKGRDRGYLIKVLALLETLEKQPDQGPKLSTQLRERLAIGQEG